MSQITSTDAEDGAYQIGFQSEKKKGETMNTQSVIRLGGKIKKIKKIFIWSVGSEIDMSQITER